MKVICIKDYNQRNHNLNGSYNNIIVKNTILILKYNFLYLNKVVFGYSISHIHPDNFDEYFMSLDDYRNYKLNIILDESNLY